MKALKPLLFIAILAASFQLQASWGIYKSGLSLNGGYYDCELNTAAPDFQNAYFGRFTTAGSLTLDFSEILTFKNGASNACGGNLYYRVYRTCDSPPSFSSLGLGFCCNFGGTDCGGGGCGPDVNSTGDQKWKGIPGSTINLISSLTLSGAYIIEVYFDATGDDAGGCTGIDYSSNGGANYRAYFEFEMNDNFTDLNFSTPTWNGDAANFSAIANSTCSGLTGSEAYRTHTVQLAVGSGSGSQYISTQIATWDSQQEWYFWVGRNGLGGSPSDLDANNQQAVYLYSNASDLESSLNGYRILIGQTGTSYIRLQRVDSGTATTIFTSSTGIPTGLTDYGVSFKVTRSQLGVWTIRTSTLPTNGATTQSTPTPNSCPEVLSTVNHGNVTDNTYAPAANGYFGFMAIHDATTEGRAAAEFDNFRFEALPPDTYVAINGSLTGTVAENAVLASNYAIGVDIFNPSGTSSTTIDIVLTSGSAGRAGGGPTAATAYGPSYTTQTLTWTAGQTGTKYIYIDPDDNNLCDDIETMVFELQNVTGGTNAFIGTPDTFTLTLVDDDMGYETLVSENFNSGSLGSWVTNGTSWSASASSPIEGSNSARHSTQGSAGQTSLAYPIDNGNLTGLNTTWRFEVSFANDATANNNFQIFLSADDTDLFSGSVNGYAVVIDQSSLPSAGSSDYIRLYRVDGGAYASTPIINSTTDWVDQVNSGTRVGIEVTLNDAGTWELSVDDDGDFDALASLGTGTDLGGGALTYGGIDAFGIRFNYLAAASDLMRFDNITVSQSGCKQLYYSRNTGSSTGAIWSTAAAGAPAPSAIVSGRYDRFVIQSGHNVTATGTWLLNDITIESGATLTGGTGEMKVHGNWINEGTFTANTSEVIFKGQAAQSIGFSSGAVATTFNNLTIDNDGFSVTIDSAAVSVTGVVSMLEGTLNTSPGTLTLISNSSGSASIGEIVSGATLSGNVTLQRYIPSIATVQGYWFNLGCPLTGQTIADWNDDMTTTGFTGSDYPWYPFNNIQYYDESVAGTMNTGYVPATNVTNALETSRGYFLWLEGPAMTIDNTGGIQSGTFTQPLSYTNTASGIFNEGWNLLTNRYPSEVDWDQLSSTLSGPRVYYVFDYESLSYKYYNAATSSGTTTQYIPHSQSFLVKANTTGESLAYQENYKTNTGAAFERNAEEESVFIALQISRNGVSDESILLLENNASAAYDLTDALDLESPVAEAVEISLMSEDAVPLAQDARPLSNNLSIPVELDLPSAGTYTFVVSETQNLPFGSCLYVEDLVTGEVMSLQSGASMSITISAPFNGVRLMIHGTAPIQTLLTDATCYGGSNGTIDITTPSGNWSVSLSGSSDNYEYVSGGSITFDHLQAGNYTLEVSNSDDACGSSSTLIEISEPSPVLIELVGTTIVECNTGNTGMISANIHNATWFTYEVVGSSGNVVMEGEVEGNELFIETLPADIYTVYIFTTCENEIFTADLRDPGVTELDAFVFSNVMMDNNGAEVVLTATSSADAEILWSIDNGLNGAGNTFSAVFAPGTYTYAVVAQSECTQSVTGSFEVGVSTSVETTTSKALITLVQNHDGVLLNFNESVSDKVFIRLYDMQGRELYNNSGKYNKGQSTFIDLSTFSKGIYNLQVTSGNQQIFASQVFNQ